MSFLEEEVKRYSRLVKASDSGLGNISYNDFAYDLLAMSDGLRSAGGKRTRDKTHLTLSLDDWVHDNVGGKAFLTSGESLGFVPWLAMVEVSPMMKHPPWPGMMPSIRQCYPWSIVGVTRLKGPAPLWL
jgi:hypothetical protein